MPKQFLQLPPDKRGKILEKIAKQIRREPVIVEKDIWVCWTLQSIFSIPDAHPMAFKGGTSLTKAYDAINRLSEDVDITLDYRAFADECDPFADGVSKNAIRRFADRLKVYVYQYATAVIVPHIEAQLKTLPGAEECKVSLLPDDETIRVQYRSVIDEGGDYVKPHVLVELGGRNDIDPHVRYVVKTDVADLVDDLVLPSSEVVVLSAERTFWEKVTLMHVECHREKTKTNPYRLSRHWYDLKMLAGCDIGKAAINNRALLEKVVRHKKVFFNASYANYDACLANEFRLVPDDESLEELRKDYNRMLDTQMIYDNPVPSFDEIIADIQKLERTLNGG